MTANISIPPLQSGDTIGIVAPARKISPDELLPAVEIIKQAGFKVVTGKNVFKQNYQFAGTDEERKSDFQEMINDNEVKAMFAARGGYGSVRIVDNIDFTPLLKNPKWIAGYSDITVFHNHINNLGIQTLHATMPVNFTGNDAETLQTLFDVLRGKKPEYVFTNKNRTNKKGRCKGKLAGGNLSVLYSLLGSKSFPATKGKILFIEDVDEHLYHIDRMMSALKRAGIFKELQGMVIGAFTKMHNRGTKFGKTAFQIIEEAVKDYDFPVAYGFPAGHQNKNLPLIMGAEIILDVEKTKATLSFL